jgi:hypothetical protein
MEMVDRKNTMLMVCIVLGLGLILAGCSGSSILVGRWDLVEGSTWGNPEEMELLKNGTGIVDEMGITWKAENGRFYITHPLMAFSSSYKVSGSTLTLTTNDGEILIYKKK